MTGLFLIELKSPAMWEAYSKGTGPRAQLFFCFAFEALSCPCVTCLSNVVGGGLLADGQTLMQLATWGSAMSFIGHR